MKKELKEKIAVNAANEWCRCFKCDGRVNATGCACDKDKRLTCHKWYDGYRTALLALEDDTLEVKEVDIEKEVINWWNAHYSSKAYIFEGYTGHYVENSTLIEIAKHFFELGLKAQKGE